MNGSERVDGPLTATARADSLPYLPPGRLTERQRQLVRQNIGLVAVHLRRNVGKIVGPRRDREWEDLFQEGCLGLIQAALAYREERGIPFASFALLRIRGRVSHALRYNFSTVHVPRLRKSKRAQEHEGAGKGRDRPVVARARSLSDQLRQYLGDGRSHEPCALDHETIGQRLRGKYERAVQLAVGKVTRAVSIRGDRHELVRAIVAERLLVPHEETRRTLRAVARDTNSSYGRVADCEKQLCDAVRNTLEADPEFIALRCRARASSSGIESVVDADLERALAAASGDEFVRRLREATATVRARMLDALLNLPDGDIDDALRTRVVRLSPVGREALLRSSTEEGRAGVGQVPL